MSEVLSSRDETPSANSAYVFLCHNSKDKPLGVETIYSALTDHGVRVWIDRGEFAPGDPIWPRLGRAITGANFAIVCVGKNGLGPVQEKEIDALLNLGEKVKVILVLLPEGPGIEEVKQHDRLCFLATTLVEDLREGVNAVSLDRIAKVIKSEPMPSPELILARHKEFYLSRIADANQWINLFAFARRHGSQLRLPLDSLFIHLHAQSGDASTKSLNEEELASPYESARGRVTGAWNAAARGPRLEIDEALRHRRVVVLGEPGAGKSTLLQYLARQVSNQNDRPPHGIEEGLLPVFLSLNKYDQHCQEKGRIALDGYVASYAHDELGLDQNLLASHGEDRCLFLLDGLDEITDARRRKEARDAIVQLTSSHSKYSNCRFVLTSRTVGYTAVRLPGERDSAGFAHFTLCPFNDDDIEAFATAWYFLGTSGEGSGRSPPSPSESVHAVGGSQAKNNRKVKPRNYPAVRQVLAKSLADEIIRRNPGARRLASNPLLMTLLAVLHENAHTTLTPSERRQGPDPQPLLPQRRVELYRACCDLMLVAWPQERGRPLHWDKGIIVDTLARVAFAMHERPTVSLVSEDRLKELVKRARTDLGLPCSSTDGTKDQAAQFVRFICEEVGLLDRKGQYQGDDHFGFLHLSFQEYFAALELARRWKENAARGRPCRYVHDPAWEEPIRLAAAHLGEGTKEKEPCDSFVRAILNDPETPYEDVCRRNWLLAALCLADVELGEGLTTEILRNLEALLPSDLLREQAAEAFAELGRSHARDGARDALVKHLDVSQHIDVRCQAAYALGSFGTAGVSQEMLAALLPMLDDDNSSVREAAARTLGRLCEWHPPDEVIAVLVHSLREDLDWDVSWEAAQALGRFAESGDHRVIPDLLALLDCDWDARYGACVALGLAGKFAARNEKVTASLLHLLQNEKEEWRVRAAAARALGRLAGSATAEDQLIRCLLEVIQHSVEWRVRDAAADALGSIGKKAAHQQTIDVLVGLLRDEATWRLQRTAARTLGLLGAASAEVVYALLPFLDHDKKSVRWAAGQALGRLGGGSERELVIDVLLERLQRHQWWISSAAAEAFGAFGESAASDARVVDALVGLLQAGQPWHARDSAAWSLGWLGESAATGSVITALLRLLRDPDQWHIRANAAKSLGRFGKLAASEEVIDALLKALKAPQSFVRSSAAEALGRLGERAARPDVLDRLHAVVREGELARDEAFRALTALLPYCATM